MTNLRSIEGIWEYAIGREIEANAFYKNLAPLVEKAKVRETIESFAEDEYQHKLRLVGIRDSDITFTDNELDSLGLADCLDDLTIHPDMTYMELLAFAIKKENKAHSLYTKLAQFTTNNDFKKLLNQLAQEEAQHRFALEFEYDLVSF